MGLLHNNRFIRLKLICSISTTMAKRTHRHMDAGMHMYAHGNLKQPEHVPTNDTHTVRIAKSG